MSDQGKPMARFSANVNGLSAFCRLMALCGSTKMTTQLLKAESRKQKAKSGKQKAESGKRKAESGKWKTYTLIYPDPGSLNKNSCLAPALGVTKFTTARYMSLVTLCCAT